jgi:NAD(P)-dependent dehydrogenase (short-subunit alcohol dehydrogenase family)
MSQVYLVTGANGGLGLDSVRKLAILPATKTVYLACRSEDRANEAIEKLVTTSNIDEDKLQYVHFDACASKTDLATITKAIDLPLNGVILNAGGIGGDTSGKSTGVNNVLNIYQMNVIGNLQLVEILRDAKQLASGCRIVYSGSEGARGVPMMMIGDPDMGDTSEWYQQHLTGQDKDSGRYDSMSTYAEVKGVAALYWAAWARRNSDYHVLCVSPGATSGTEVLGAKAVPLHFRVMMPVMKPVMQLIGVFHSLEAGSQRYIDAVLGTEGMAQFASGTFVASRKGTTGEVCDQATLEAGSKYGDHKKQEAAFEVLAAYT